MKANLVDVGVSNVMMLEIAGHGGKDGLLSALVPHLYQTHIARKLHWDGVEMLRVDE